MSPVGRKYAFAECVCGHLKTDERDSAQANNRAVPVALTTTQIRPKRTFNSARHNEVAVVHLRKLICLRRCQSVGVLTDDPLETINRVHPLRPPNLRQHVNRHRSLIQSAKRQHLAHLVERYAAALIYNHQAVGKHPRAGFGSPYVMPAHPPRRVCVYPCTSVVFQ
jgi:hypothetical protein